MEVYLAGVNRAVDSGNTYFNEISLLSVSARSGAIARLKNRPIIAKLQVADVPPLQARAEHGRWIVDCPNCNGAEFAFDDGLFVCSQCLNSNVSNKPRVVTMPANRQEIETELGKRPIKNRNWNPGQTLAELKAETNNFMGGG